MQNKFQQQKFRIERSKKRNSSSLDIWARNIHEFEYISKLLVYCLAQIGPNSQRRFKFKLLSRFKLNPKIKSTDLWMDKCQPLHFILLTIILQKKTIWKDNIYFMTKDILFIHFVTELQEVKWNGKVDTRRSIDQWTNCGDLNLG